MVKRRDTNNRIEVTRQEALIYMRAVKETLETGKTAIVCPKCGERLIVVDGFHFGCANEDCVWVIARPAC